MNRLDRHSWLGRRVDAALASTIPACLSKLETTGRLDNLAIAAGRTTGKYRGRRYDDSDVMKTIEAIARALSVRRVPALRARGEKLVELVAAAQRPDGYLNSYYTVAEPESRWKDVGGGHELYCAGHLIEAAIAWKEATGSRALLDVAVRLAEHVDATFGPGRRSEPPGHPEIELALFALHRATGERRWRDLASFFLDARGRYRGRESFGEYAQDHAPVGKQREAVGHAVRALYLMRGAAERAAADEDWELLATVKAFWADVTERKSYLTGGVGSSAENEGFTEPYDLPREGAYGETCASIALFLLGRRLLEITRDAAYADRMEQVLENALLAGVSFDGDKFFYSNPMASDGSHRRQTWFECACCPTNLARFLPGLAGHVLLPFDDGPALALFAAGEFTGSTPNGPVRLSVETSYPLEGTVFVTLGLEHPGRFVFRARRPGWLRVESTVRVNGKPFRSQRAGGWIEIEREWRDGDVVALGFPLLAERVPADPRVAAVTGRAALRRGPLVFCVEGADHDGTLVGVRLPADAKLRTTLEADLGGGSVSIRWTDDGARRRAIPYAHWAHREAGPMAVWLPE